MTCEEARKLLRSGYWAPKWLKKESPYMPWDEYREEWDDKKPASATEQINEAFAKVAMQHKQQLNEELAMSAKLQQKAALDYPALNSSFALAGDDAPLPTATSHAGKYMYGKPVTTNWPLWTKAEEFSGITPEKLKATADKNTEGFSGITYGKLQAVADKAPGLQPSIKLASPKVGTVYYDLIQIDKDPLLVPLLPYEKLVTTTIEGEQHA